MNFKKGLFFCFLLFVAFSIRCELHTFAKNLFGTWQYVDFDESMRAKQYPKSIYNTINKVGINGFQFYVFFKNLYEQNNLTKIIPVDIPRIPKLIHLIWLGSPLPDVLKRYVNSWKKFHSEGWKIKLWTDRDVKDFRMINQDLYDEAKNPGVKSDILRYEIIYRYGGLYVDTDFECLQPMDIFHHTYDFYTGLLPLDSEFVQIANALFGACPGHPILKNCIDRIRKSFYEEKEIPKRTGPIFFTKSIYELIGKTGMIDMVFPATYFYPLTVWQKVALRGQWRAWGSFGVHWWAKSWLPPEHRMKKFESIKNYDLVKDWNI